MNRNRLNNYSLEELKEEIFRREEMMNINLCKVCHRPCGAGGCHEQGGFNLRVTKELKNRIMEIKFEE